MKKTLLTLAALFAYALTPKLSATGSFDYTRADYPRGSGSATLFGVGLSYAF